MIRIASLLLLAVLPATAAESSDPWTSLRLKPGTSVVVMRTGGSVHRGRLLSVTSEAVGVQTAAERVDVERRDVAVIRAAGSVGDFHTVYAPWDNLGQLPSSQPVRVIRRNWSQLNGTLSNVTEEGITLFRRNTTKFVPRRDIRKVRILVKSNVEAGKSAGAAIGFCAVLAAAIAAATQGAQMDGADGLLEFAELASAGGSKAGGTVAKLFDEYQTIYVPPRK